MRLTDEERRIADRVAHDAVAGDVNTTDITRDGLPDRLRALAEDEIAGRSPILSPANSHDLLAAADEIASLRLTDAEREAIAWLTKGESPFPEEEQRMATLRALLQRHEKGGEA